MMSTKKNMANVSLIFRNILLFYGMLFSYQISDEEITAKDLQHHSRYADAEILQGKRKVAYHCPLAQRPDKLISQNHQGENVAAAIMNNLSQIYVREQA